MRCECCSEASGTRPRSVLWMGRTWRALICDDCADGGHMYQRCFLCDQGAWDCARLAHVYAEHQYWLRQMDDDPDPTGAIAARRESRQRHIGRIPLRLEGE